MTRDLTKAQFDKACKDNGWECEGFMGYYRLNLPGQHYCVSVWNAGSRRRDQLAYLAEQQARVEMEPSVGTKERG